MIKAGYNRRPGPGIRDLWILSEGGMVNHIDADNYFYVTPS